MRQLSRAIAIIAGVALAAALAIMPTSAARSEVSLAPVLDGYSRPVLVTHAPGTGRTVFIVEQTGKIKRATYRSGRWQKLGTFLDLSGRVNDPLVSGGERGLLGLAFHPRYRSNGLFYVNYTRAANGNRDGDNVIAEFQRRNARSADPSSGRIVMVISQPASTHNAGHLAFGPDGYLYVGSGDGGGAGDTYRSGQRLNTRLGKLLRIDPRDPDGKGPRRFRSPSSNPRVGKTGYNDIWAWGLRNPWRFSFDRQNGDLWIGDVGQREREEVNHLRSNTKRVGAGKGRNFGWNRCEGKRRYPNTSLSCPFGTPPVHDYAHGKGRCSVTGGYVHRGPNAKAWHGLYVAGDFCGRLFALDGAGRVRYSTVTAHRMSSLGEDAAGRLFTTDLVSGKIYQVRFQGPRP